MLMEDHSEDQQISDVFQEESSRGKKRRPTSPEQRRKIRQLGRYALKAIQSKDARAYGEMLRAAGIREGSPEYVSAWKAFHSGKF